MTLDEKLTVSEARAAIDAIVATTEALLADHGIPRSVTFAALAIAATNAVRRERRTIAVPVPTGRPQLAVVR